MVLKLLKYTLVYSICALIAALILFTEVSLLISFANLIIGTFAVFLRMLGLATLFSFGIIVCIGVLLAIHRRWFE